MSRTEGVNVRAIPSPSPRYDRSNEAQFRRAMEISLERLNTRIQTVGLGDDETILDPDADEEISGDWDFTGSPSLPESSITDGSILARLADDETVTGTWQFSNDVTVNDGGFEAHESGGTWFDAHVTDDSASRVFRVIDSGDNEVFRFRASDLDGAGAGYLSVEGDLKVATPSSGGVVNVVHHGTGTPSSVGVEGTLHTQDA